MVESSRSGKQVLKLVSFFEKKSCEDGNIQKKKTTTDTYRNHFKKEVFTSKEKNNNLDKVKNTFTLDQKTDSFTSNGNDQNGANTTYIKKERSDDQNKERQKSKNLQLENEENLYQYQHYKSNDSDDEYIEEREKKQNLIKYEQQEKTEAEDGYYYQHIKCYDNDENEDDNKSDEKQSLTEHNLQKEVNNYQLGSEDDVYHYQHIKCNSSDEDKNNEEAKVHSKKISNREKHMEDINGNTNISIKKHSYQHQRNQRKNKTQKFLPPIKFTDKIDEIDNRRVVILEQILHTPLNTESYQSMKSLLMCSLTELQGINPKNKTTKNKLEYRAILMRIAIKKLDEEYFKYKKRHS